MTGKSVVMCRPPAMPRLLAALIMCTAILFSFSGLQAQGKAKFKFVKHSFGEIKEEAGPVVVDFSFANIGSKALVLKSVKATCGCTTPVWSRDSIMPGDSGFIKVRYNPLSRPGNFDKVIHVTTDGRPAAHTLRITGKVIPRPKGPKDYYPFQEGHLRFRSNHLTFGDVFKDQQPTASTVIYNAAPKPIKFSPKRSKVPRHLRPRLSKYTLAPGDTMTIWVTYIAERKADWGFLFDNIFLATSDPYKPMKRLNISAKVLDRPAEGVPKSRAGRLRIDKATHNFGKVTEGEMPTATFPIRNSGSHPLLIRKVSSTCACITAESSTDTIPAGQKAQITVTFNTRGRIGKEEKEITLISNDPYLPERILKVEADIRRPE